MAKRRTKAQKAKAKTYYSLPPSVIEDAAERSKIGKRDRVSMSSLYSYDAKLLQRDLQKTLVVSLVILLVELLIYYLN